MEDYLNVIYNASENRARMLETRPFNFRVPQPMTQPMPQPMHPAMPQGYYIYCPNPPAPLQIPNNPVMYHDTPKSTQAIGSKRHLDSNENDRPAKHTKNEPNYLSKSGFYNKMCEILTDLPKYKKIFTDHDIYFKDMLRPRESISLIFQEITEDLTALKHKNYDVCKYANNCNRKECCAFLNPEDTLKIINAYKYFDIDVYDFKHCKKVWKASIALKSLKALHDATWYIFSRKRLANKLIVEKK
jgi:hypothetical protein